MPLTFNLTLACLFLGTVFCADKHCCPSNKFYGMGMIVTASLKPGSNLPMMSQNRFTFDYDFDNKMQRVNGTNVVQTDAGETVSDYQMISDYNLNKSYTFDQTNCKVDPITDEMRSACVDKSLTLFGAVAFGSGTETAHVNAWFGQIGNESMTMTTTVNDCTIVSYTILGALPDGTKITETGQFANIVQGRVSYSNAFDIPAQCKPGTAALGVGK